MQSFNAIHEHWTNGPKLLREKKPIKMLIFHLKLEKKTLINYNEPKYKKN